MSDDIIGYVFDALEPREQDDIEKRLDVDPAAKLELDRIRGVARLLAEDDHIEAPTGLADRAFANIKAMAAVPPPMADWVEPSRRFRMVDIVVAASILLLATTLVFPAVAALRGDQARVGCAAHLRDMGVALAMYADQEHGQLPYVQATGPFNNAGVFSASLKTRDLLTDGKSLLCPSANNGVVLLPDIKQYLNAQKSNPIQAERFRRYMAGNYGYVLGYNEASRHRGLNQSAGTRPVMSDRPPRDGEEKVGNSPNHLGRGQNVLFLDGGVRWINSCSFGRDEDLFHNRETVVGAGLGIDDTVIGVSESVPYPTL